MSRDNGRCQSCGRRGSLHAHHVTPARVFTPVEDGHHVENLVILCKRCHQTWEGRDLKPDLADAETETSVQGVVGEITIDLLCRECLPAALPEILARHFAADPAICSHCLATLSGQPEFKIFDRMGETLRAVAFCERSLPSSVGRKPTRRVENYCSACDELLPADESAFLGGSNKPERDKRCEFLKRYFNDLGFEGVNLKGYQSNRRGELARRVGSRPSVIAASIAEDLGLPIRQISSINAHLAVTDRDCDFPSESDGSLDYPRL